MSPTIDIVSTENGEYRTHLISRLTVWQWKGLQIEATADVSLNIGHSVFVLVINFAFYQYHWASDKKKITIKM